MSEPYGYRTDPTVPSFPDDRPLIVFDGLCVLCSGKATFVMRHDPHRRFRLLAAQSVLGRALYQHYGLDPETYDTFIVLIEGRALFRSAAALKIAEILGPPWSAATILRVSPGALRDSLYALVARHRLRIFGRRASCLRPTPNDRDRFLA